MGIALNSEIHERYELGDDVLQTAERERKQKLKQACTSFNQAMMSDMSRTKARRPAAIAHTHTHQTNYGALLFTCFE